MQRKLTLIEIGAGPLPVVTPVVPRQSSWFPVVYVSPDTPPVDGVVPVPVADGVLIEWAAVDQEGLIYIIERGPSEAGPWTEIHRTTETRYLYSDGSGQAWWFKITASVRGKPGDGTVVGATPGQVPSYEEMEELNNAIGQEIIDRLAGDLKATNEAVAAARTYTDAQVAALNGILEDIVGADEWAADETYPVGDFVQRAGTLYRSLQENTGVVPGTDPGVWQEIGDYTSVGEALAASISMSTQNASDILAEATRVDAVVARMPAGTGELATEASVSDLSQATTDSLSAMGQRVGAVEAKVPADGERAASTARVASVDQARADGDSALGQRLDQTNAELEGKASADALQLLQAEVQETDGQVDAIAQAIANVRSTLPAGGGNAIPNAAFGAPLTAWGILSDGWGGSTGPTINGYGAEWHPAGMNAINYDRSGVVAATGASLIIGGHGITVVPGERWIFSAYLANHRCRGRVMLVFTDSNYNTVGPTYNGNFSNSLGGTDLRNWTRSTAIGVVPEGATIANLWLVFDQPSATEATPVMWMLRPMFERATADQAVPSAWQEGAAGLDAKYAAVTQSLETRAVQLENGQTQLLAKAGVMLDVNKRVIGWEANNDGEQGTFDVVADRFGIVDPNNTGSTTFEGGRWVTRSGGYVSIHGKPFGQTGDLMMYIGIGSDPNQVSKNSGLFWIDNQGNAYFGGSLSVGILRNAVQTTTTQGPGTELINGPFRTNGGVRSVSVSYSRTHQRTNTVEGNSGFVAGAGANTATIQVYRRIGSAAETLWQVINAAGGVTISNERDGPDTAISSWGGAFTLNDTSDATQDVTYRAVITAFSEQAVTHQSGSFNGQSVTQNLSIVSVEG